MAEQTEEPDDQAPAPFSGFDPLPDLPPDAVEAARSGELVIFVGAGISRLVGAPDWGGFADAVLRQLVDGGCLDHYALSQLQRIQDPKKRLSLAKIAADAKPLKIEYLQAVTGSGKLSDIYKHLNRINCPFVTTNYDKFLLPEVSAKTDQKLWRHYDANALEGAFIDMPGSVVHIHGCVDGVDGMVVTTRQYLEHYSNPAVQKFLRYLFNRKTVVFLGYGLEELELLEYVLSKGQVDRKRSRYVLQGFFNAELELFNLLDRFYFDSFNARIIPFPKDAKGYDQQVEIIEKWQRSLQFGEISLVEDALALEEEIKDDNA